MQINPYQQQLNQISQFKTRVLDAVQKKQFNQESLGSIIKDTFSRTKVSISYDDKTLDGLGAKGYFYAEEDGYNFIFPDKDFSKIKNKNLGELEQVKKLKPFGEFFGNITHEVKHGMYETFNGGKQDFLYDQCAKIVTEDVTNTIIDNDVPPLVDKCTDGVYYKPGQVSGAITRIANKYGQKDNKLFQKIIFLSLLDDIKNEHEAYLEGFKAKKEVLGDKARFYGMKFPEAVEDNHLMREIVQEGYLNKFMPVKKLNRYF